MRGDVKLFEQPGKGGVNFQDSAYTLKEYEARDARNMVSTVHGAVRKRQGTVTLATISDTLTSLFASSDPSTLIAAGLTKLYKIDSGGVVTDISGAAYTSGVPWEMVLAAGSGGQGPVYAMNGVDAPRQWPGTGNFAAWTASTGTLPNGTCMIYAGNRVFVGHPASGTADPDSTVYFSNVGDPRDWPVANVVLFDPNDGDEITGLGTIGQYVLVFKNDKAWVVYDLDTGANRKLGEGIGCVAKRTIVETPSGTFFLSKDHGVMVTDGSTAKPVSNQVLPLIRSLNPAMRANACGAFHNDHYYLSFSVGGIRNDIILDYDIQQSIWWVHVIGTAQVGCIDFVRWAPSGDNRLYGVRSSSGKIDQLWVDGITQDGGETFSGYWNGPFHLFGAPALQKRCRDIRFDGAGRVSLSIAKDFANTADLWLDQTFGIETVYFGLNDTPATQFGVNDSPTQYYGGISDIAQATVPTTGIARAWSICFGNNTADPLSVEGYSMAMQMRKN
jgi:hypothetical protein